jgi:hypothetical protein
MEMSRTRRMRLDMMTQLIIPVREPGCKSHVASNEYPVTSSRGKSCAEAISIGVPVLAEKHKPQVSPV